MEIIFWVIAAAVFLLLVCLTLYVYIEHYRIVSGLMNHTFGEYDSTPKEVRKFKRMEGFFDEED